MTHDHPLIAVSCVRGTPGSDHCSVPLDDYGRRGLARGSIVVVLSDGWAQDDPELVAAQMSRLRRLAFRIVWVNPRKAAQGFASLVGGMAAALPYCDAFVSGHSLATLEEVAAAIRAPLRSSSSPAVTDRLSRGSATAATVARPGIVRAGSESRPPC